MERLQERQERKHVSPPSKKPETHNIQAKCLVGVDKKIQFTLTSLFFRLFSFYQANSRKDYSHTGIRILKLLQSGTDLQPVMRTESCHRGKCASHLSLLVYVKMLNQILKSKIEDFMSTDDEICPHHSNALLFLVTLYCHNVC